MNWIINLVLNNLLGKASSLAGSDRVRAGMVHALLAILNSIGLPILIMKANAFCASIGITTPCVSTTYAEHVAEIVTAGILAKGAILIHSITNRDTLSAAQEYDKKVAGMDQAQITAAVLKGILPATRPAEGPKP